MINMYIPLPSFHGSRLRLSKLRLVLAALVAGTGGAHAQGLTICNHTPFDYEAIVALPYGEDALIANGWYPLQPGACARPEYFSNFGGGLYFRRAQVLQSDEIAAWVGADVDVDGWTSICTSRKKFDEYVYDIRLNLWDECNLRRVWFDRHSVSSGAFRETGGVWAIEIDAFPARNAEEALHWRR